MSTSEKWTRTIGGGSRLGRWGLPVVVSMVAAGGCGQKVGALMYIFGVGPKQRVSAEYKLPKGPVLVLVDDDLDLIQPPLARHALVDELAKQLREHGIAERVTTNEELARIRQSEPDFDGVAADAVGRLARADTVLWLSTKEFFVEDDVEIASSPGRFTVVLKVVNALAKKRQDVRLWPPEPEGRLITVTLKPHEIRSCKTRPEVHQKTAAAMADKVARLFYDWEAEQ